MLNLRNTFPNITAVLNSYNKSQQVALFLKFILVNNSTCNIRMDPQEVGCGYMDWIGLAQDRDRWRTLVSAVMNLRVP